MADLQEVLIELGGLRAQVAAVDARLVALDQRAERIENDVTEQNGSVRDLLTRVGRLEGGTNAEAVQAKRDWRYLITQIVLILLAALTGGFVGSGRMPF